VPGWLEAVWHQAAAAGGGLTVTALAVLVLAAPLARGLRVPASGAAAWLAALGIVATLTLTPRPLRRTVTERVCTFDSWAPPELHSFLVLDQRAANVLLLVPFALLCALPRDRRLAAVGLGLATALPFLVEGLQYAVPALGRVCHAEDLVDNLLGVAGGVAVGLALRGAAARHGRRPDRPDVPRDDPAVAAGR